MWKNFDGKPYTREEFTAHVASMTWVSWKPRFITLHNTGGPTLAQWYSGGATPQQRIKNLEYFYEFNQHWHEGPHLFIDRDHIWGFSDLTQSGVHASCFNGVSIGIEMVGDFGSEPFDPLVRDNTVFALAALHNQLGIRPDGLAYGRSGLHFHIDCKRDGHPCPGKHVDRGDMVARTLAEMARQAGGANRPVPTETAPSAPPTPAHDVKWIQTALRTLGVANLDVDGDLGPATEAALRGFRAGAGIKEVSFPGPLTMTAVDKALTNYLGHKE